MRNQPGIVAAVLAVSVACAAGETPTAAFFAYHDAALKAKSLEDLASMLPKADRDKIAGAPDKAKQVMLRVHQDMARLASERPKVLSEKIDGDKAVLQVETVCDYKDLSARLGKKPCQASVNLVKESGAWKVTGATNWQVK